MTISSQKKILVRKTFISFLLFAILFIIAIPAGAENPTCEPGEGTDGYCLLAPLTPDQTKPVDLGTYLATMFRIFIAVAGILATLMIIIAGFQYMMSEAGASKAEAKKKIWNAILGLLLALGSYAILNTINPNLVNVSFTLEPVEIVSTAPTTPGGGISTSTPPTDDTGVSEQDKAVFASVLANEEAARNILGFDRIRVKEPICQNVGAPPGCTNVGLLNVEAVRSQLRVLQEKCFVELDSPCSITITGGTEWWLHGNKSTSLSNNSTQHRPGNAVVDIRKDTNTDKFIKEFGELLGPGRECSNLGPRYRFNGKIYVDEGTHWHACL